MKNKIFIVSHKLFKVPLGDIFQPILVGKKNFDIQNSIRDDIGDNIAEKNPNYCELTALYWIWKNYNVDYNYIGLCHYRRYFTKSCFFNMERFYLDNSKISEMLKNYDIILPNKFIFNKTLDKIYFENGAGKEKDLVMTRYIINKMYPEYIESFDEVINSKSASYCNMFITNKNNFKLYCEWLFSILFSLENVTDLSEYTTEEARIYGYLSELLLNVWIRKNKLKVKEVPVALSEDNSFKFFYNNIKKQIKSKLLFK